MKRFLFGLLALGLLAGGARAEARQGGVLECLPSSHLRINPSPSISMYP